MKVSPISILLADDDKDDCLLFKEALDELEITANLTVVNDGEQLMQLLSAKKTSFPNLLFLDINMPKKNGLECLLQIKKSAALKNIPVVILSTSFEAKAAKNFLEKGARHYIRKPSEFSKLKQAIHKAIDLSMKDHAASGDKQSFLL